MKKTLWKPSTCQCEVEYEWDRDSSEATRTHVITRVNDKNCQVSHPKFIVGEKLEGSSYHNWHKEENRKAEEKKKVELQAKPIIFTDTEHRLWKFDNGKLEQV